MDAITSTAKGLIMMLPKPSYSKKAKIKKKNTVAYKRKKLEKDNDNLWSEVIKLKAYNKCELCGNHGSLNSHHIFPRGRMRTRWNLLNGVSLCIQCHMWRGAHSTEFEYQKKFHDWINEYRGVGVLDNLKAESHEAIKRTLQDLEAVNIALKVEKEKYA